MPSADTLAIFLGAAVVFALAPGPAVFYIVTTSLVQGRAAGVISALAVASGNLLHVGAAMIGVSALVASSAVAFTVVKYLGAAYLIYLGVRSLLRREEPDTASGLGHTSLAQMYRHGLVVAILNPKTALFFLAFLPQFVDASSGPVSTQIGLLGVVLVQVTALSDIGYAVITGTAGAWIRRSTRAQGVARFVSGGSYLALGIAAAATGRHPAVLT